MSIEPIQYWLVARYYYKKYQSIYEAASVNLNLQRGTRGRERGEPDGVAEVDGHGVEALRLDGCTLLQVLSDRPVDKKT